MKSYKLAMTFRDSAISVQDIREAETQITTNCRYYLIGLFAIQEKAQRSEGETLKEVLTRAGKNWGYSDSTLEHCCNYVKAIESLMNDAPDIVPLILEGKSRLSVDNTVRLSRKAPTEIRGIIEKLADENIKICEALPKPPPRKIKKTKARIATVKDTPAYDPDTQIMSLTYTVPTWLSAIEKAFMDSDFDKISFKARYKFLKGLTALKNESELILALLKEVN
jgi:hypothetical protein